MPIYLRAGMLCLFIGRILSLAAQVLPGAAQSPVPHATDTPAPRATDTLAPPANRLKRPPDTLREIRILGQKPLTEKKLDRTIVHVDALLANTGGHAWDVLENTPGVTLDEDGTISLNGKDGVLILIDDRPTYLSGGQLMNYLKTLPAAQLEQIELLPTPPARYPASGGAGIIIIRTKKARTNGFQAQISSTYAQGVYPKTNHSLSVNGQYNSWQFNVMAGYSYTRNWYNSYRYRDYFNPDGSPDGSVDQTYLEESRQHEFDYSVGVEHKGRAARPFASTSWGFLVSGSANPYHETGHYTNGFYDARGNTDSLEQVLSHFNNYTQDLSTNVHILRTLSHKGRSLSADADYVDFHQYPLQMEYTTTNIPGDTVSPQFNLVSHQPFTAGIYSLKADYTDQFGSHTFLESGVQSTWSLRRNAGTYLEGPPGDVVPSDSLDNTFRYNEQIRCAYAELRHERKHLSIQAGLRLENTFGKGQSAGNLDSSFRINYTNLFPSVHALWSLDSTKRHQVGFSYARRIDRPDYGDLNPARFYFDQNTYFSGNPALQPEFQTISNYPIRT